VVSDSVSTTFESDEKSIEQLCVENVAADICDGESLEIGSGGELCHGDERFDALLSWLSENFLAAGLDYLAVLHEDD